MLEGLLVVVLMGSTAAQDTVTMELAKVLKKSKYFLAKLEMVADELATSALTLGEGVRNFSSLPEDCGMGNNMALDGIGNGTDCSYGTGGRVGFIMLM